MKRFLCLTFILALTACGKSPDKVVSVDSSDTAALSIVQDATKQLNIACTGLNQYSYDLVKKSWTGSVGSNAGNPYNYHTENWGWNKWVEISVQVSPKARDLPKEWDAPGKIIRYDLGGGKYPGIATRDKLAQLMCGSMSVSNNVEAPDSHLDWPELAAVDKLP